MNIQNKPINNSKSSSDKNSHFTENITEKCKKCQYLRTFCQNEKAAIPQNFHLNSKKVWHVYCICNVCSQQK